VSLDSDVSPDLDFDDSESWIDPIVGGRIGFDLGSNFFLTAQGDVGGFDVGSELTWQLMGTVGYRFSDAVAARVGYRYLDVDYDDDDFVYDVATRGFVVGVTFSF
jgi:opacity protein-like surface antigen